MMQQSKIGELIDLNSINEMIVLERLKWLNEFKNKTIPGCGVGLRKVIVRITG